MELLGECLKLLLYLAVVPTVYCQSQPPSTENPRDYLFAKKTEFVWRQATNNTRFTDEEKKYILQIHNSYRSLVEPPATDMRELVRVLSVMSLIIIIMITIIIFIFIII